jgi:hypothetical protein
MKKVLIHGALLFMFICTLLNKGLSQQKAVSEEDKQAIIKLFEGVDKNKYRLEFNKRKEVFGSRKVAMKDLRQVSNFKNPAGKAGYVVLIVSDDGIVYVLAVSKGGKLQSVIGREKAAKLDAIMAKYAH